MKPGALLASLRRTPERNCPVCNKPFTAIVTKRTCSMACKQKLRRLIKKDQANETQP